MKRKAYGRDFGLSSRMFLTMFTLGLLYVVFFVVLLNVLNVGIFAVILIIGVLAFVQYYTSDKIALLASGAKVVEPDEAPELHAAVAKTLEAGQTPEGTAWAPKLSGGRAYKNAASRVSFGVDGDIVRLVLKGPEVWGHIGVRGRPVRQMLPDAGAELPKSVVRAIEAGAQKVLDEVLR